MVVTVILDKEIAEEFSANVVGSESSFVQILFHLYTDPSKLPPTIVNSGSIVDYNVTFLAFDNSIVSYIIYTVRLYISYIHRII